MGYEALCTLLYSGTVKILTDQPFLPNFSVLGLIFYTDSKNVNLSQNLLKMYDQRQKQIILFYLHK